MKAWSGVAVHGGREISDSTGTEVLGRRECLRLLAGVPLGRIVYTEDALPAIRPVGFALRGGAVVIRAAGNSKMAASARNSVVAFQADEIADDFSAGWSVSVVGHALEIRDPTELEGLALRRWAESAPDRYLKIIVELVAGWRIRP